MATDERDIAAELDMVRERNENLLLGHKVVLRQAAAEIRRLEAEVVQLKDQNEWYQKDRLSHLRRSRP